MTIFEANGVLGTRNSKKNTALVFDVPDGIRALRITYSYSPKIVEDTDLALKEIADCFIKYEGKAPDLPNALLPVKNLVTLSLDSPNGYVGAAHRQADYQEHIISAEYSSPGFIKCSIARGRWQVMLNAHSISCEVSYRLSVEGDEE